MGENNIETTNPYSAPEGELLSNTEEGIAEIGFFNTKTRIGRIRYLSHIFLFTIGLYVIMVPCLMLTLSNNTALVILGSIALTCAYVFSFVLTMVAGIQRLHDLNHSGWFLLLFIVPLINLALAIYLLFFPGDEHSNNYGYKPPPNKTWNWVCAFGIPVMIIVGIIAAAAMLSTFAYTLPNQ